MQIFMGYLAVVCLTSTLQGMEEKPTQQLDHPVSIITNDNPPETKNLEPNIANLFTTIKNIISETNDFTTPMPLKISHKELDNIIAITHYYLNKHTYLLSNTLRISEPQELIVLINRLNYLDPEQKFFKASLHEIGIILKNKFLENRDYSDISSPFYFLYTPHKDTNMTIDPDLVPELVRAIAQDIKLSLQKELVTNNIRKTTNGNQTILGITSDNKWQIKFIFNQLNQITGVFIKKNDQDFGYALPWYKTTICPIFSFDSRYAAGVRNIAHQEVLDIIDLSNQANNRITLGQDPLKRIDSLAFNTKKSSELFYTQLSAPLVDQNIQNQFISKIYSVNCTQGNPVPTERYQINTDKITAMTCHSEENSSLIAFISYKKDLKSQLAIVELKNNEQPTLIASTPLDYWYDCTNQLKPQIIFLDSSSIITGTTKNNTTYLIRWKLNGKLLQKTTSLTLQESAIVSLNCDPSKKYIATYVKKNANTLQTVYLHKISDTLQELAIINCNQENILHDKRASFIQTDTELQLFAPFWQKTTIYPLWRNANMDYIEKFSLKMYNTTDQENPNIMLLAWLVLYKIYVKNQAASQADQKIFAKLDPEIKEFLGLFHNTRFFWKQDPAPQTSDIWSQARGFISNLYKKFNAFNWRQKTGAVCVGAACAIGAYALYKNVRK